MNSRKVLNFIVLVMMLTSLIAGSSTNAAAMPGSPTDETKVPHYFGPYPNWANSPYTLPDATVTITGNGSGAQAFATVGANGAITNIIVTDPGSGYSSAKVDITGAGTGATASATIIKKGSVVGVTVATPGTGYTAPVVAFSANNGAAATAFGGVEAVSIVTGGSGYTFPTVDFDLPDAPGGLQARGHAEMDLNGTITAVIVDNPGSGYMTAPGVAIHNGTLFDPALFTDGGQPAVAATTLFIQEIVLDTFGGGYTQVPDVVISDPTGTGATATAALDNGIIASITVSKPGSGYLTPGGIRKFVDGLAGLTEAGANNLGQYLPIAQADTTTFPGTDYYVIGVVQHREKMHSDLPPTLLREYVQLSTGLIPGKHVALQTDLLDNTSVPTLMPDGTQAYAVDNPHYLGPVIVAQKDRAVRIVFYNLLPTGAAGDLFLPVDSTMMGSGMGPMGMMDPVDEGFVTDKVRNPDCTEYPKSDMCFKDNRATLHLHGGVTPWISDGTPHQWITPANEMTPWPQGVSVVNVPDMEGAQKPADVPDCTSPGDGCQSFYYTNQQSARLMFYHDHSWGITRLNVYAGEAAGYVITDPTEQALVTKGIIPADSIPLVIQDRTFVPQTSQLAGQDPTWDASRWGSYGNLWYHHVYMPAQNPGDPGGMSAYGRWMYGPWFWPPATPLHAPIPNPYYNAACNLDDPTTWQYQTDPFCEPAQIPGTPNISAGMEQFNDTPLVNGTAYPTTTLQPKSYRLRILNAANDRFWNLQWYVADSTGTEVALKAAELEAAQTDPVVFPTPDTTLSPVGPSWIQIGTEGGFLPAPVVVPNQPITWITDPTRFDVGNVDKHSLLLAPAERADVIVDFSKYAGKTLILYNDAPAAFPARVPQYDYYTGGPDLSPVGAATILPGYGPNTRTIMQVKIAANPPAAAFNLTALNAAFRHHADGSGVFESGQHPIIVGQATYNSAYGTSFASSGWCNSSTNPSAKCDGYARILDQGGDDFKFDTLSGKRVSIKLEPKAIHDEMNSAGFDEFGRMTANLGLENVPATPGLQNVMLYPFTSAPTEIIDGTNLPKSDIKITPINSADGTQIWKITHNGVDTHPIHFHLYDVQILNRVTWDNIIIPPDATELGWKDTVRISPLEDTLVALRPIIPVLPFDIPNSVRNLDPMMPVGAPLAPGLIANPQGNPVEITNHLVNFGWEYVYHCHILSHEEMDMMRPVLLAIPPVPPVNVAFDPATKTLTWTDNSLSETAFAIEKSADGLNWSPLYQIDRLLSDPNATGEVLSYNDPTFAAGEMYRVAALNTVGDILSAGFPTVTTKSAYGQPATPPAAPSNLTAAPQAGPKVNLAWNDNANNETGFLVERSTDGGASFTTLTTLASNTTSYVDSTVALGTTYVYQVVAVNLVGSTTSNQASVSLPAVPADPASLTASVVSAAQVDLAWTDASSNEDGFVVERSSDGIIWNQVGQPAAANATTFSDTTSPASTYWYRVFAFNNISGNSQPSNTAQVTTPDVAPAAPSNLTAAAQAGPQVSLAWNDNANNETGFVVERSTDNGATFSILDTLANNTTSYADSTAALGNTYVYQVKATNAIGDSTYSNQATVNVALPTAPSGLTASAVSAAQVDLAWTDTASNEAGFDVERSIDGINWTKVGQPAAANAATFSDTTVSAGVTYWYQVSAFNILGSSLPSNSVQITTPAAPAVPAAPTNLAATLQAGPQVSLTWADNADNETGFVLERSTNGGAFSILAAPGIDATSYVDNTVTLGNTYAYQVKATNAVADSAYSNQASVIVSAPARPTGLNVTNLAPTSLTLNWTDRSNNEDGFTIQIATNNSFTNNLQTFTVGANVASFDFTGLAPTVRYYFRVRAFNAVGISQWSPTINIRTLQ